MSSGDDNNAEGFKEQANEQFKRLNYTSAIELYTKAIELDSSVATYYGNRSFAYLKTELYGLAIEDASKAIELDKFYVKGYYRKAAAHYAMGKFEDALKDFDRVVKVRPNDPDAKKKYQECKKIVTMARFNRAIAVDDKKKSVAESINLDAMTIEDDYSGPQMVDGKVTKEFMEEMIKVFKDGKRLHKKYAYKILLDIKELFEALPTLIDISVAEDEKFTICGDIHGQYFDLLNIFELNGLPSEKNPYLFNGDFVDRGSFSVECIFTLFGFKLLYPKHFFMARGNHESQTMNQMYGFEGEVKAKFTDQMYNLFAEVFNLLPLSHCINKRVLVMHGGIFSDDKVMLDDIRQTDRNRQPPDDGIMCELLWSDPMNAPGRAPSKRGVGVQFGPDVTEAFCKRNSLDYIVRSHEVKADGYEVAHDNRCITVFSAPNYCDTMGNKGAFITMNGFDMAPKFTTYEAVPHPNVKPMAYANSSLFGY